MDTRRLVIGMILAMAVVFGWQYFVAYLYKKHPEWKPQAPQAQVDSASSQPAVATTSTMAVEQTTAPTQPATGIASTGASGGGWSVLPRATPSTAPGTARGTAPATITLGASGEFPLKLELTPRGAGIAQATLKQFKMPDGKSTYIFQLPPAVDSTRHALATRSVTINGQRIDLKDAAWTLERSDERSAAFTLELGQPADAGQPAVRLRKTFTLTDGKSESQGYRVEVQQSIENLTDQLITARLAYDGPTLPPNELMSGPDLQVIAGYDDERQITARAHYTTEFVKDRVKQDLLTLGGEGKPFVWAGMASVYFNAIIRPLPQAGTESGGVPIAKYLQTVQAEALSPSDSADHRDVVMTFETSDLTVAANAPVTVGSELYLGPKQRALLNNAFYSEYPRSYNTTLVISSGMCSVCTFTWLIDALVKLLAIFHWVFGGFAGHGDWGLAIIALVVLVRSILHPITKRSQVSMMKMGKMGPEVEKLKKKYGEDKDALNKAMMELYKTQGATPILGCLPMFLQMPIWIALWASLQSTFELRQAPFLWGWTWIDDLAKPDLLIDFNRDVKLFFGLHLAGVNLLPILMGFVFFLQQKFTPKPPAANEQQEQQQKMMMWMSLLFPIFLYNGPSGLNLYILTSTSIGIIESKIVRDHIKEQEEREKAGPLIIDAPPEPKKPRDDDRGQGAKRLKGPSKQEPPKAGVAGWMARMQEKAQEIRREAERRKR